MKLNQHKKPTVLGTTEQKKKARLKRERELDKAGWALLANWKLTEAK
jgi:hypothetical protein